MDNIPPGVEGVVFAANGAGDFRVSSLMLNKVIKEEGVRLHLITVPWSHGYGRVLADQIDRGHVRSQGEKLAQHIEEFHYKYPDTPVYLWGHSAGAAVILVALENLPPGRVDKALLLSPSISIDYDIRPALRSVNQGLHVFYSLYDWAYLGIGIFLVGTSDRQFAYASGRFGFQPLSDDPEDQALYAKLFQRPWQKGDNTTGNFGGHYGNYQPDFIRQHLLPLLRPPLYHIPSSGSSPREK